VKQKYSVTSHTVTALDPTAVGATAAAQTLSTLDNLGRTRSTARSASSPTGIAQTVTAAYGYDKTGAAAYSTDTFRSASYAVRDGFGRVKLAFSIDKLQMKSDYDAWDQIVDQQVLAPTAPPSWVTRSRSSATPATSSDATSKVDLTGTIRYRQTYSVWEDRGQEEPACASARLADLTSDLSSDPDGKIRATSQSNDGSGRLLDETYGSATDKSSAIAEIRKRHFEQFVGDVPTLTPTRTRSASTRPSRRTCHRCARSHP